MIVSLLYNGDVILSARSICMSATTDTETGRDGQSFAETAMRLGGKSDEEARRLGAVDRADDQVEALFATRYQTVNSPVHKAVWDGAVPLELFSPPPLEESAPSDAAMQRCLDVVKSRRDAGTFYDDKGKIAASVLEE